MQKEMSLPDLKLFGIAVEWLMETTEVLTHHIRTRHLPTTSLQIY
jgi:hypothetical protein